MAETATVVAATVTVAATTATAVAVATTPTGAVATAVVAVTTAVAAVTTVTVAVASALLLPVFVKKIQPSLREVEPNSHSNYKKPKLEPTLWKLSSRKPKYYLKLLRKPI